MAFTTRFEEILQSWSESARQMDNSEWFQRVARGELELAHYKGFLLETYHHAGLNPQIQAYATMFFKENHRDIWGMFYKHATSEIGHDLMALDDLCNLGGNRKELLKTRPQPETAAFNAYVLYQIQFKNPVAYLGYLFHLEFLPTKNGRRYIDNLKAVGVPDNALTFLEEHSTVDIGHNKLMERYVEKLVQTEEDFQLVVNAAADSCRLHQLMIEAAFKNGERKFSDEKSTNSEVISTN